VPQYRDVYRYDPESDRWQRVRDLPFGMSGGSGVVLRDRYVLLMGTTETRSHRVGKTDVAGLVAMSARQKVAAQMDPQWTGYNDVILCYDVEQDRYARLGVMLYGVATVPWVTARHRLYGFGGEPMHRFNDNTENVLQIGEVRP
jgi:N-acetylneuraminic acid mutarotase